MPVQGITNFDRLSIPFRAVATDLVTGEEVVLSAGSLADALRASMSVPGAFSPVQLAGLHLVDGGMANNLPVSVVRDMGADIVIAVDISTPLLTQQQLTSVVKVAEQLTGFLTRRNTEEQIASLGPDDILLIPDLEGMSAANFENADEIAKKGLEAAMARREELLSLSVPQVREPTERPASGLFRRDGPLVQRSRLPGLRLHQHRRRVPQSPRSGAQGGGGAQETMPRRLPGSRGARRGRRSRGLCRSLHRALGRHSRPAPGARTRRRRQGDSSRGGGAPRGPRVGARRERLS